MAQGNSQLRTENAAMNELGLEITEEQIPGAAPVSANSRFSAVANAGRAPARVIERTSSVRGSPSVKVRLRGEWRRRAMDQDPEAAPVASEFDDTDWDSVFVPNNFGLEPSLSAHFGPVYYRCRIAAPQSDNCTLIFDAVDYLADVWIDREHLGHHEGYFAPFSFDISGKIGPGSILTVRVQDPFEDWAPNQPFLAHAKRAIKGTLKYHDSRPGGLPGSMTPGWNPRLAQSLSTGGITGNVWLRGTGAARIDGLFVTTLDHEQGVIHVALIVTNLRALELRVQIQFELGLRSGVERDEGWLSAELRPGASRIDVRMIVRDRRLWWPVSHADLGNPELYEVRARVVVEDVLSDEEQTRFGIRTARVTGEPKRMVFNGRDIFVQAANYIPRQHFADVDAEFYRRDMKLAAQAHLNSFGVHGHLQPPSCYDAADEEGMLMFQDFALQWHYDSGKASNPGFIENACRQIAEMAYTYWNHPSIVYWACHNEPNAMFLPGQKRDAEADFDNQVLDEALEIRLRQVEPQRHIHRASGIGDDLHLYDGSLSGGDVYKARKRESWFVSEFGFWTLGPRIYKWNDQGWPPDDFQMRNWLSRLSFGPSTMNFAGMPQRYANLQAWQQATEIYGAFLAKYQTEWFRIGRGAPFNAYRWHFFADWWGWAGGGLVDVDRKTKATYHALAEASRPVLVCTSLPHTVFPPGNTVEFPIHAVNEKRTELKLQIEWRWIECPNSIVIGIDKEAETTFQMLARATPGAMVAVPEASRPEAKAIEQGIIEATVRPESSQQIGLLSLKIPKQEFAGATLMLSWGDETNWYHVLAAAKEWFCGPGAFKISPAGLRRLGE
jgi:beta-mannosidase